MPAQPARIVSNGTRSGTKVFLNDVDITKYVTKIAWEADISKNGGVPSPSPTLRRGACPWSPLWASCKIEGRVM